MCFWIMQHHSRLSAAALPSQGHLSTSRLLCRRSEQVSYVEKTRTGGPRVTFVLGKEVPKARSRGGRRTTTPGDGRVTFRSTHPFTHAPSRLRSDVGLSGAGSRGEQMNLRT